jgi:hypothetical protein
MATRTHRTITVMPTVNDRRRADLHHMDDVTLPMTDADVGRVLGECLRRLAEEGIEPGSDLVTLDVRFA